MNRKDRRDREKEQRKENKKKKEAMEWFRGLPPSKQLLVDSLVKIEARKDNEGILQAIDRCFSAAAIQEIESLEWEDIKRIIDKSAELMLDDAHKIKGLKDKLGGSYEMAIKKVNEMGPVVEKRIREYYEEGYNQKLTIKALTEEFKELSTSMITNAYKKTIAIIKEEEKLKKIDGNKEKSSEVTERIKDVMGEPDKEIEDALEYIFEESKNKAHTEEKEVSQVKTLDNDEKSNTEADKQEKRQSKLKVINEVVKVIARDIQGEYGIYHIENNVMNVNEEYAFSNADEVKDWAGGTRIKLEEQIEKIKAEIRHINMCEAEAIEVIETYM